MSSLFQTTTRSCRLNSDRQIRLRRGPTWQRSTASKLGYCSGVVISFIYKDKTVLEEGRRKRRRRRRVCEEEIGRGEQKRDFGCRARPEHQVMVHSTRLSFLILNFFLQSSSRCTVHCSYFCLQEAVSMSCSVVKPFAYLAAFHTTSRAQAEMLHPTPLLLLTNVHLQETSCLVRAQFGPAMSRLRVRCVSPAQTHTVDLPIQSLSP